jgi:hypothetical protein
MKLVSGVGEGFDSLPRKFASKDSITKKGGEKGKTVLFVTRARNAPRRLKKKALQAATNATMI